MASTQNETVECGICKASVGQNGIGCDLCPRWFHTTTACTGLKLEIIQSILEIDNNGIFYKYNECRCSTSNDSPGQNLDTSTAAQLFKMIRYLAVTVNHLSENVSTLAMEVYIRRWKPKQ